MKSPVGYAFKQRDRRGKRQKGKWRKRRLRYFFSFFFSPAFVAVDLLSFHLRSPTDPFTISEPQNQEIGKFYVVPERPTTDYKSNII